MRSCSRHSHALLQQQQLQLLLQHIRCTGLPLFMLRLLTHMQKEELASGGLAVSNQHCQPRSLYLQQQHIAAATAADSSYSSSSSNSSGTATVLLGALLLLIPVRVAAAGVCVLMSYCLDLCLRLSPFLCLSFFYFCLRFSCCIYLYLSLSLPACACV